MDDAQLLLIIEKCIPLNTSFIALRIALLLLKIDAEIEAHRREDPIDKTFYSLHRLFDYISNRIIYAQIKKKMLCRLPTCRNNFFRFDGPLIIYERLVAKQQNSVL